MFGFEHDELLIGMAIFFVGNIFLSFVIYSYVLGSIEDRKMPTGTTKDEYNMLKNALLSMALMVVYGDTIDDYNYDYNTYNGSILPPLSGSDPLTAYMSYLVDSDNSHIHAKYNAIQRFMHSHLLLESEQKEFLEMFLSMIQLVTEEVDEPSTHAIVAEDVMEKNKED